MLNTVPPSLPLAIIILLGSPKPVLISLALTVVVISLATNGIASLDIITIFPFVNEISPLLTEFAFIPTAFPLNTKTLLSATIFPLFSV